MVAAYGFHVAWRKALAALGMAMLLAAPAGATPVRLLVLGDSLSAGYDLPQGDGFQPQLAAALANLGHPVDIIDGAISGDTTADGLARLDWILGEGVEAAIVELGANDGLRGIDPTLMDANLSAILNGLARHHVPVLLAGMYAAPNMGTDYARAFRDVFNRLSQRPEILYYPFFLNGIAEDPRYTLTDHMHPNARGVRVMVAGILPLVLKLLAEVKPT
jgi:acyl-CoA thioesterase I